MHQGTGLIGEVASTSPREWLTSSYSNASGSCVEVNVGVRGVMVRDSKDRRADQPVMSVSTAAWNSFLEQIC
ncbi:DUF397 domain-containing protein [Lentzea cavernae]|uniref:DUF397 domain-containing protein n=1 Tax=Lentzea cavernae TaxID=2020703 RepID=UPI001E3050B7|nr:DUF397 domain-containing protein [Lentzea cavernae]